MLNLTRDINSVAYRFTNAFETIANRLLRLTGPGMFGSITIASVLLPHQDALYELELATGHWSEGSQEALSQFRDELLKTGEYTEAQIASMQRAFAESHLQAPPGVTDATWINDLTQKALLLKEIYSSTDQAAQELLATAVSAEQRGGRTVDLEGMANMLGQARTRMGWSEQDMSAFWQRRLETDPAMAMPVEAAMAVGQMGRGAGVGANEMTAMLDRTIGNLHKGARDQESWAAVDLDRQGASAGRLLGAASTGDMSGFLAQLAKARDGVTAMRDLGDGSLFASEEDAVLMQALVDEMDKFDGIMGNLEGTLTGSGDALGEMIKEAENVKPLMAAMEGAYTALKNAFTIMADAGVLNALTKLMLSIERLAQWFNNLPDPIHRLIALLISVNIWFGVITSTATVLIGVLVMYIMYLWGMSTMIRIALLLVTNFGGALVILGNILTQTALRMQLLALSIRNGGVVMARFGIVGTIVTGILRLMSSTMLIASRLLHLLGVTATATGKALAWTAVVGRALTFVYSRLMWALGRYIAFQIWQIRMLTAGTAAVWRYVAARFAETAILGMVTRAIYQNIAAMTVAIAQRIALGLASLLSAVGLTGMAAALLAVNIAGGPIVWIIGAIILGVAALAVGVFFLIKHFRSVVDWVKGLSKWFLLLLGPIGLFLIGLSYLWNSPLGRWLRTVVLILKDFLGLIFRLSGLSALVSLFTSAGDSVGFLGRMIGALGSFFTGLGTPIGIAVDALKMLWSWVSKLWDNPVVRWIMQGIKESPVGEYLGQQQSEADEWFAADQRRSSPAMKAKAEADKEYQEAQGDREKQRKLEDAKASLAQREQALEVAQARFKQSDTRENWDALAEESRRVKEAKKQVDDAGGGTSFMRGIGEKTGFAAPSMDMDQMDMAKFSGAGMGQATEQKTYPWDASEGPRGRPGVAERPDINVNVPVHVDASTPSAIDMARTQPLGQSPSAIDMARRPDMNLPVGGGAIRGDRVQTINNDWTLYVTSPEGVSPQGQAELIAEIVTEKMEDANREAQANFEEVSV